LAERANGPCHQPERADGQQHRQAEQRRIERRIKADERSEKSRQRPSKRIAQPLQRETKARLYVARLLRRRRGRIAARAEDEDERKQNPALQDEQKSNDAEVEHKL